MRIIRYLSLLLFLVLIGCKTNTTQVSTTPPPPITFMGSSNPQIIVTPESINPTISLDNAGNLSFFPMENTNYYVLQSSTNLINWTNNLVLYNQTNCQVNFDKNNEFFKIRVIDATKVGLAWDFDSNSNLVSSVTVYYGNKSLQYSNSYTIPYRTNETIVTGLTPNTNYFFSVTCSDVNSNISDFSNEVEYNKDVLLGLLNNNTNVVVISNTNTTTGGTTNSNPGNTNIIVYSNPPSTNPIVTGGLVFFYKYNGSNSQYTLSNLDITLTEPYNTNNFTATAWIKTVNSQQNQEVISKYNITNREYYAIAMANVSGYISFTIQGPHGSPAAISDRVNYGDNNWHNLAMVCSNGIMSGYVDSKLVGTIPYSQPVNILTPFTIGQLYTTNSLYPFQGIIDNVSIYSRALQSNEISEIYNQTNQTN